MLTVDYLSVNHGNTLAVSDVTWKLGYGVNALLGPNGAGKSSLLRTLATLDRPSSGKVHYPREGVTNVRENLGYLPQENIGRSRFTVTEFLEYSSWLKKIPAQETTDEVNRSLALSDLEEQRDTKVSSLSGGMKRRLGIASAVIGQPELVLLDEPSSGLDISQRSKLQGIIDDIRGESVVITSTHVIEDVIDIADTVTVMDGGKFRFFGEWSDLCDSNDIESVRNSYLRIVGS